IIQMLHGFRDGMSMDEIFRSVLQADPEEIDEEFDSWLRQKANPADARTFMTLFSEGAEAFQAGDLATAKRALEQAAELFPVAARGSPYSLLAQIHLREGNTEAAIEALRSLTEFDETAYRPNLELARLLEEAGDLEGAAAALEREIGRAHV